MAEFGMNEGTGSTVGDSSGSGNTGVASGTSWSAGKFGQALTFNGTTGKVSVNHSSSLNLANRVTMEAWVNPTTLADYRTVLMKNHGEGSSYGLYASADGPPSSWVLPADDLGHVITFGQSVLPANQWTHLAATYDGTVSKLYVNGALAAQEAAGGPIATSNLPLWIGANSYWGEYFKGRIDEVRVYNRVLSQSEIQVDMARPVGQQALSAKTAAAMSPTDPGVLPSTKWWPDNIDSWKECEDHSLLSGRRAGWLKNRFNWCQTRFIKARRWVENNRGRKITTGELKAWQYVRVESSLDKREFTVYNKIIPTSINWGTLYNADVELLPAYRGSSGSCWPSESYGQQKGTLFSWGLGYDGNDWDSAWTFKSTFTEQNGPAIEQCNVKPVMRITGETFNIRIKNSTNVSVRCDRAAIFNWYPQGGCVVSKGYPVMHMGRYDVNEKGQSWPEQYDAIWRALHLPTGSWPEPGGVNFPNVPKGTPKSIPGLSISDPLHRATSGTLNNDQRTESQRICRTELRRTWPGDIRVHGDKALNCDEYPFASTHEGSLSADPRYNYSVFLINARHNQRFGNSLGAWFHNNRMLDWDPFLMNLHTRFYWT